MKRCFTVESDCLGIVERLKKIDQDYVLFYNLDRKKYELHNKNQQGDSYCLTFPFEVIDERMLDLAMKTRVENSDALFEELEKENSKREKKIASTAINAFKESLYES